jgi:hypothetical protein
MQCSLNGYELPCQDNNWKRDDFYNLKNVIRTSHGQWK